MTTTDCIDAGALEHLRHLGGPAFVQQMIGLFLDLAAKKLEAARCAERAGDVAGIGKAVHPLRSSSGNVGARAMQDLATRIEELAKEGQADQLPSLLRSLEAAFVQVQPRLIREREALNS